MRKVIFLIFNIIFKLSKCALDYCVPIDAVSCRKLNQQYEVPEEYDKYAFQTPPRNDPLGYYYSTYQDMNNIVGWIEFNYNEEKTQCNLTFNTKVNSKLGTVNEDYYIYYTFGDYEEQESNKISLNKKDDSYPNGLSPSCRIVEKTSGDEIAVLKLQNVYLIWDNIEVDTPNEYEDGQRGAIVELFGWSMEDIAEECEFLGVAGYLGVRLFSPYESLLSNTRLEGETLNPWWYGTQVVSFKYDSRSGNEKLLKKIINKCRAVNVRVYAEIVINHMTREGYDINPNHYDGRPPCESWGPVMGSGGSPFYTTTYQIHNNYYTHELPVNEYPAVPYFPSDFHCGDGVANWNDPFQLCYYMVANLEDINTEKEYVRRRIATYIVDLLSIGISGVVILNGGNVPNFSYAKIFRYTKEYLGGILPPDFMVVLLIEGLNKDMAMCNQNGNLDFGTTFTNLLRDEGFNDDEIIQIKLWFKGSLAYESSWAGFDVSCGAQTDDALLINVQRWTISLEYYDDINRAHDNYNIYIKHKSVTDHKNALINDMFLNPRFNYTIKFVFTSYSVDNIHGIPDGKSEKSFCASDTCFQYASELPYKRAYNPYSTGYDCGDGDLNWKINEFTRVHRDKDIVNAMREWMYNSKDKDLTEEELYSKEKFKADCDKKCLICNEESKLLDKCILCDTNNDYFPAKVTGENEDYYECFLRTEKVERFYYSNKDKAFLPCYETCKYCNESGTIKDHKCTKCDYNFMKKPGTKEKATDFNCVVSCLYNYYLSKSGQYKCTNSPTCPSDSVFYVQENKKCVSSCKGQSPYIYLHNGNCLEDCPGGYDSDETNNICIFRNHEQCTLISKNETLNNLYSAAMLNWFAKRYRDEYTYSNKLLIKLVNPNYNIFIFKDFDCIKELGLNIIDVRLTTNNNQNEGNETLDNIQTSSDDTCYKKVQKVLETEEQLVIVYFEDITTLIPTKGYLLYNPFTGLKTDFESICGEEVLASKEDMTSEVYFNNTLKYIYLKPTSQTSESSEKASCEKGKSPIYKNDVIIYSKCLDRGIQHEDYYYDSLYDLFMPCHENCKYCERGGSVTENYCLECANGYIKYPLDGRRKNYNCIIECAYSFYFNSDGIYSCTLGPTCPVTYSYYIPANKQCIDSCQNDDIYIYTYNGNCVIECPSGLIADNNGFCVEKSNSESKCSLSKKETTLRNFDSNGGLDTLVNNYYKEFYYTNKHVSEFNSKEYDIIIYIDKSCLTQLNLDFAEIDFGNCYLKVQKAYGLLNDSLIVVLLKKIDSKTGGTTSSYSLYNPFNGLKLDAANICKDEEIVIEESIFDILEDSGIEYENIKKLMDQDIDVFDTSGEFYTDICFEFDSPIDRDITLEDRLEEFFPNISLCDSGCQSKGINLTTMKAICSCTFKDISSSSIVSDIEYLNEITDIISSSNIQVLKCINYIFKRFKTSVGGYLMIFCILIVMICGLIFYLRDMNILKKYIIDKTTAYIKYLKKIVYEQDGPKNSIIIIGGYKNKKNSKEKNLNKGEIKIKNKLSIQNNGEINSDKMSNSQDFLANKNKINDKLSEEKNRKQIRLSKNQIEDFIEYLTPELDDLEFEDIMLQDKRSFKEYFIESLNEKQLFLKTFKVKDNFNPTSLKIILFTLTLVLYIVINGFFYGEEAISEIYHIEGEDSFFGFFPRSIERYVYCAIVSTIVNIIVDLFFVPESNMKRLFTKYEKNISNLKIEITRFGRNILIRYIIFINFVLVLFILLTIYLLCFNYVYPHTQVDWVKSSIFLIIIMQILTILVCLLETCLRFLAFYYKNEKIYKISKWLD